MDRTLAMIPNIAKEVTSTPRIKKLISCPFSVNICSDFRLSITPGFRINIRDIHIFQFNLFSNQCALIWDPTFIHLCQNQKTDNQGSNHQRANLSTRSRFHRGSSLDSMSAYRYPPNPDRKSCICVLLHPP